MVELRLCRLSDGAVLAELSCGDTATLGRKDLEELNGGSDKAFNSISRKHIKVSVDHNGSATAQALGQVGLRIGSTADHPTTAKEAPALMLQHDDIIWLVRATDPGCGETTALRVQIPNSAAHVTGCTAPMMDVAIEDQSAAAATPPAPAKQAAKPRLTKRRRSGPSKSPLAAAAPPEQQSDAVTQPVVTQPVVTQPVVIQPVITQPVVIQPVVPLLDLQLFGELCDEDNTAWLVRSTRSATTGKLSLQVTDGKAFWEANHESLCIRPLGCSESNAQLVRNVWGALESNELRMKHEANKLLLV